MKHKLPPATYIDTQAELQHHAEAWLQEPLIAVDTESNNLYAYHGRVCLIQLSTRTQDFIIDPVAIGNLQVLGDVLAEDSVQKIFHAAEYDLICMRRDFGFEVCNLFDTMYAARFCHIEHFGLADLLLDFLNVKVDKRHQLDDWGKRPLPKDSLAYAQMDTHYLPTLRDILLDRLVALDRVEEAEEVFADVLRIEVKEPEFDPDGYWKLGLPHSLNRRQMAVLRELYLLRDALARKVDKPPFKVFSNRVLVSVARNQPREIADLHDIHGLSNRQIRRYGDDLLAAVSEGWEKRLPKRPRPDNPDPVIAERYIVLHTWRKELGIKRGLDSNLIVSKQTLWDLAHRMPGSKEDLITIEGLGWWRIQNYGDEILELIASMS